MFIDSHCHLNMLDLSPYEEDLEKLIEIARHEGIKTILNISTCLEDREKVVRTAQQFAGVYATVGIHPHEKLAEEPSVETIVQWGQEDKVIGIGECGLDYYYNSEGLDQQRERFRRHIRAARALKKPLIIHSRSAHEDTLSMMKEEKATEIGGIMHCFTESWEMAEAALELGFYISISGIVTFKKADNVKLVAQRIPLDRLLVETDAPYLAPEPHRGKKNEPRFIKHTVEFLAQLRNMSVEELAEVTTKNFLTLFKLHSSI